MTQLYPNPLGLKEIFASRRLMRFNNLIELPDVLPSGFGFLLVLEVLACERLFGGRKQLLHQIYQSNKPVASVRYAIVATYLIAIARLQTEPSAPSASSSSRLSANASARRKPTNLRDGTCMTICLKACPTACHSPRCPPPAQHLRSLETAALRSSSAVCCPTTCALVTACTTCWSA